MDEKSKDKKKYAPSVALQRRETFYPPQNINTLITGITKIKGAGIKRATVITEIVKDYFDKLPEERLEKIKRAGKNGY
jgi:hypothetical protein